MKQPTSLTAMVQKQFRITFEKPVDPAISEVGTYGIENLEWTPEVYFADNVIRNNRARGSLFSTPKKTVVEKNVFDHTSGTAILLCGDCNGWFETGACHDVQIRNNKFINALTNSKDIRSLGVLNSERQRVESNNNMDDDEKIMYLSFLKRRYGYILIEMEKIKEAVQYFMNLLKDENCKEFAKEELEYLSRKYKN